MEGVVFTLFPSARLRLLCGCVCLSCRIKQYVSVTRKEYTLLIVDYREQVRERHVTESAPSLLIEAFGIRYRPFHNIQSLTIQYLSRARKYCRAAEYHVLVVHSSTQENLPVCGSF